MYDEIQLRFLVFFPSQYSFVHPLLLRDIDDLLNSVSYVVRRYHPNTISDFDLHAEMIHRR